MPETTLIPADLIRLDVLATRASQGPYKVHEYAEAGPWDHERDEPTSAWWLDGPDWLNDDDGEFNYFSHADALYFAELEPARVRELVRLARIGMEYEQTQAAWRSTSSDPSASVTIAGVAPHLPTEPHPPGTPPHFH